MFGIKNKINFNLQKEDTLVLLALIFSIAYIAFFNLTEINENSFLENIQLVALLFGAVFSLKAKNHKVFFNFLALVLFLLFLREISYGRVFIDVTKVNFNRTLVHILVGVYIAFSSIYALFNKIWVDVINIIKTIKLPFWTFFFSFICVLIQVLSESFLHNSLVEETVELMLYCLILALVLIYQKEEKAN